LDEEVDARSSATSTKLAYSTRGRSSKIWSAFFTLKWCIEESHRLANRTEACTAGLVVVSLGLVRLHGIGFAP
jgi:hypothetical protein